MSCKTFNIKSCEIRGATFQGRKIDFVNKVITQDSFKAKVYDTQGYLLTEIIGIKSGSVVYFPFTAIQNLSKDKYRIKYWADFYLLGTILLGEEELTIGNTCPNCEVDDSTIPFVLELGTETIDFTLQLVYIAIGNGSGEVDLSEYLKRVDADELYALKNHTHSYNDLTDLPPNQNIDSVVTIGAVTATINNVNLALHFSGVNRVYIGGENYYKITEDNFSFTPVTTGIKVLLIYALPDSQIFYLAEGIESTQAVEPTGLPTNALLVARLIVSTTGTVVEESNTDFKLKLEDYWQNWYVTNTAGKQILGTTDARGSFYITKSASATGSVTIGGLSKIVPETEDAAKIFYEGREFWIYNATGEPMLLNSTGVSPVDTFLISDKLTPFTVKNNTAIKVKLRGDILEILPSGSDPDLSSYATTAQLATKLTKPATAGTFAVQFDGTNCTYVAVSGENISNANMTWAGNTTQNLNGKKLAFTGGRFSVPALEMEVTTANSVPNKIWNNSLRPIYTNGAGVNSDILLRSDLPISKLLKRYIHTANREIYPTAIDYATGYVTATAHGFAHAGQKLVGLFVNNLNKLNKEYNTDLIVGDVINPKVIPFEWLQAECYVKVIDANTIMICNVSGSLISVNPSSTQNSGNIDNTKWHIEDLQNLEFFDIPDGNFTVEIQIKGLSINRGIGIANRYITPHIRTLSDTVGYTDSLLPFLGYIVLPAFSGTTNKNSVYFAYTINMDFTDTLMNTRIYESSYNWSGALYSGKNTSFNSLLGNQKNKGFIGLFVSNSNFLKEGSFLANYSVIEIFKR